MSVRLTGPEPKNPVSIFHLGQNFYLAANRCFLNIAIAPNKTQYLLSAGVVNYCLAMELFLKSLIVAVNGSAPKTHKLVELFALLDPKDLEHIGKEYSQVVKSPTFEELVKEVNEHFVKVRYGYEFEIFAFNESPVEALATVLYILAADRFKQPAPAEGINV